MLLTGGGENYEAGSKELLGLGEAQPGEDEGSGQFRLQARRTLEALEVNSRFLSNVESPRSLEYQ